LPPLRILLAEDNRTNQQVAQHMLEKEGHAVVIAVDGLEALALLDQQEFDLVLMDVQMPELDGYAATGAIREREKKTGGHLPIIALTAHALKGDLERCLEAGMDGYVAKPLNAEDLRRTMWSILGRGEDRGARDEGRGTRDEGPGMRGEGRGAGGERLPVLDQEALFNRVGDDRKRLGKWSELFQSESPRMVAAIQDAIARGDGPGLCRAAHTLKGSLATLGSVAAADAARRLEELGRSGQLAAASDMLTVLKGEIDLFQATLAQLGQVKSV
jgi:CheY-like chemotaxis protein